MTTVIERQPVTFLYRAGSRAVWADIRVWVLNRDALTCQTCGAVANEVDHIWPRRWGGDDNIENLQALCGPCNKAKGASLDLDAASAEQLVAALDVIRTRLLADIEGVGADVAAEIARRAVDGRMGLAAYGSLNQTRTTVAYAKSLVELWQNWLPPLPEPDEIVL